MRVWKQFIGQLQVAVAIGLLLTTKRQLAAIAICLKFKLASNP
ncbi:hypothetical protein [Endozoicomonas sp. SESOKO3]|nr:hypothetical protein [Endozoicomonas sp. SESOKO3]